MAADRTPRTRSRSRVRWFPLGLGGVAAIGAVAIALGLTQVAGPRACAASVPVAAAASTQVTGTATHYVLPPSGGNCSYPGPPADGLYVALSPQEYAGAAPCGGYLEVTGPHGSVRAEIVDQCPPCQAGHIDLSEAAFARIAPLSAGLVGVTYRVIADPPLTGPVSLRVKEGSSAYWLALLPMNTGNPVASVEVRSASRGWRELVRADYNYWIAASGMGAGPFTVKITDTLGHEVTVSGIGLAAGEVHASKIMMYLMPAQEPAAPLAGAVRSSPSSAPAALRPARATRRPAAARTGSDSSSPAASTSATSNPPATSSAQAASPAPSC